MSARQRQSNEAVGDLIARYLADIGVTTVFGVISIHNMPILDAIARHGRIRFVPARGEAGSMSMADAYARVSRSLGVVITSTGTAAGNAAGAQVEALTAGSPVLHITSTVDRDLMDRDCAAIHDVPRQPDMLRAISKRYVRMWDAKSAAGALQTAVSAALSAPMGPVSLEIPIDVQREKIDAPAHFQAPTLPHRQPSKSEISDVVALVRKAKRPLLWLGGGARGASSAAMRLVERGFGVVTSTNGRGVVPETHPANLGAFNMTPEAQSLYANSDLMIVVGSRLRGNETLNNKMKLPSPLVQIDADESQCGRNYPVDLFIAADASSALDSLADALPAKLDVDPQQVHDISAARSKGEAAIRATLGPYQTIADVLRERVPAGRHPWVRDVTISNSTFGNRYVHIAEPRLGVHALGGGIGLGTAMAIGAAFAEPRRKTVALVGDGGLMLGIAELITAVEEKANVVFVLMNDKAYGVIKNIQDAQYESRYHYSALRTPEFSTLCKSIGLPHRAVSSVDEFAPALETAVQEAGPIMLEVEMTKIGPFAKQFAGPPAGAAGKS